MSEIEIFKKLQDQITRGDEESIKKTAQYIIEKKINPLKAVEVISDIFLEMGNKFQKGEIFLVDLIMAGDAAKAATNILLSIIPKDRIKKTGKIIIGTVKGDIHDLGKSIVSAILEAEGFEVNDLGVDVPIQKFIEEAEKLKPDIVGVSALMSTTTPMMKQLIDAFNELGIRDKYKIIIGGCPITKEFANEIGADDYAFDAKTTTTLVRNLLKKN